MITYNCYPFPYDLRLSDMKIEKLRPDIKKFKKEFDKLFKGIDIKIHIVDSISRDVYVIYKRESKFKSPQEIDEVVKGYAQLKGALGAYELSDFIYMIQTTNKQ